MTMAERPDTGHTEGCMSDMPLSMCQCDTPGWEPEGRYIDAETLDEIIKLAAEAARDANHWGEGLDIPVLRLKIDRLLLSKTQNKP